MEKAKMKRNFIPWHIHMMVVLVTLAITGTICFSLWMGNRIAVKYSALIDASVMTRLKATEAHLWLEEIIAGDENERIEVVWQLVDESQWYADVILKGGKNSKKTFIATGNSKIRHEVSIMQTKLAQFKGLAGERLRSAKNSAIGSSVDQYFDSVFMDFITQAEEVESAIHGLMAKELLQFRIIQVVLVGIVMALAIFLASILHMSNRHKISYLYRIRESNINLKNEILERNQAEGELQKNVAKLTRIRHATLNMMSDAEHSRVQIENQNEFLNTVIESLTHPFYVIDVDSLQVEIANSAARTEQSAKSGSKCLCYMLNNMSNRPCSEMGNQCTIEMIKRTGKSAVVEQIYKDDDGKDKFIEVHAYPIFDKDGKITKIIEYTLDITERKRAEEEKLAMEVQLRQSQKMQAIGTLAGGIAHDFNNILAALIGYADLAQDVVEEGSDAYEHIGGVFTAAERATELVKQILTFSRIEETELTAVRISTIVKDALKLLRASISPAIEFRQDIETSSNMVMANRTQIHQVIMNLCTNASHAMGEKGGVLDVSLDKVKIESDVATGYGTLKHGEYVKLIVKDTGCGMSSEVMDRIFEPFFTTKEPGKGTGMGLSVVHGIIKDHGGLINVESIVGEGTTFKIYLPLADVKESSETKKTDVVPGKNERILFIDDEEPIVEVMTAMLKKMRYKVTGETDSLKALENFKDNPDKFDLVIVDQCLPKMSGTELAREMMSIRPNLPIILCTGFSDKVQGEELKVMGIKEFVLKPFDKSKLSLIIRNILDSETAAV